MKRQKRKILMELEPFFQAVNAASFGVGYKAIAEQNGLTVGQVGYRLSTHKKEMKLPVSLIKRWRRGGHPMLQRILRDYSGIARIEFERKFLPRIVHPTMKPSPYKPKRAPTIDEAVELIRKRNPRFFV